MCIYMYDSVLRMSEYHMILGDQKGTQDSRNHSTDTVYHMSVLYDTVYLMCGSYVYTQQYHQSQTLTHYQHYHCKACTISNQ